MIRAVVLTISDSSFLKMRSDLSGPAVRERLEQIGWTVAPVEVLPDERAMIAERLRTLAGSGETDVIFTSGGTGVAARDVTPEATRDVIEKEIPGMGERMRADGLRYTELATLSRSTAGTRGRTLIVNLPGSPKGAVESLNAIVELVPHIVNLLHGHTAHAAESKRESGA